MAREQFTVTPTLSKKLREKSEKTGMPIAEIIRRATIYYLDHVHEDVEVETGVQWGGKRDNEPPSTPQAATA